MYYKIKIKRYSSFMFHDCKIVHFKSSSESKVMHFARKKANEYLKGHPFEEKVKVTINPEKGDFIPPEFDVLQSL